MSDDTLTERPGNTLTERYVHEVVRRVPAGQRDDIADELRTTIADTIEARGGDDPAEAERQVLIEMGDPFRLAARYADRPLALIGSEFYPAYIRLLKFLMAVVLPVVTAISVVLDVAENNDIGSAIGTGVGTVLAAGAQMIAWLTLVFALIERLQSRGYRPKATTWTPDQLPNVPGQDGNIGKAAGSAAFNALLIGLIVWQHTAKPYSADGERLQILDPGLWTGWIWPILLGLAGVVTFELLRVLKRRWIVPLVSGYAVAELVFALPMAWILHEQKFFNPDFLTAVNNDWTMPGAFYNATALIVVAVSIAEVAKRFREARA